MTRQVGIVAAIYRYPVKSMIGEELNETHVEAKGVRGDRVFSLADPVTGKIASAKNPSKWPALFSFHAAFDHPPDPSGPLPPARITFPDGGGVSTSDPDIETKLSAILGKQIKFLSAASNGGTLEEYWPDIEGLARRNVVTDEAMPADTFFDCATIHFLTTATLGRLTGSYPEGRFESQRFRPNFVIETMAGIRGFPEDEWNEMTLAIGDQVKLNVTGPCGRCVMTTLAQGDLPKDNGILKTAAQHNKARVGAYASVVRPGVVRRGDLVRIAPE